MTYMLLLITKTTRGLVALSEEVLAETMKDSAARISARMRKHYASTIGPPDFACITHSFVNPGAQIDDDSKKIRGGS